MSYYFLSHLIQHASSLLSVIVVVVTMAVDVDVVFVAVTMGCLDVLLVGHIVVVPVTDCWLL
jgi:hypothetical protein